METALRYAEPERPPTEVGADAEAFLATLRRAQRHFLDTVAQAGAQLGVGSGQLAHFAAIQSRLTRQLFDAQRSLLRHRAEVDAEVARITDAAESDALALTVEARRRVAAGDTRASSRELELSPRHPDRLCPTRRELVAIGASAVRTAADAEELAQVIDDAFAPVEPDGAIAQQRLAELLDEWWRAEQQEGIAVIDDARARATMRLHLASVEADEIVALAEPELPPGAAEPSQSGSTELLPPSVLDALEGADPRGLGSLLDALAESLRPEVDAEEPARPADEVILRLDGPPVLPTNDLAHEDPFRRFWEAGHSPEASPPTWKWIPTQVVLPMAAVTSLLAVLLVWIG